LKGLERKELLERRKNGKQRKLFDWVWLQLNFNYEYYVIKKMSGSLL